MQNKSTRDTVLNILLDIEKNKEYSNIALGKALRMNQYMDKRDRAFISRLTEGTIEYQIRLDYIINQFSKVKAAKCKPLIRCLLRMSVYQIFFMDAVPDEAVCSEAVKLAGLRGFGSLKGFVNGILRNICRHKDAISYPDRETSAVCYLSVIYSVPEYIIELLLKYYDIDTLEAVLKGSLEDRGTTIRVNEEKISVDEYKKLLEESDIEVKPGIYNKSSLIISGYDYIRRLPGYRKGLFTVQDESSSLAVMAAGIRPGDNIIDVCAAPGGKTMYAAAMTGSTGHVLARDLSREKTELIEDNLDRMGITNVTVSVYDSTKNDESLNEKADIVIADVPCSGLGIMGRKNDIKYNASKEKTDALIELQRKILGASVSYVKPSGKLVYSTCTINKQENEENVKWLVENFDFTCVLMSDALPDSLKGRADKGYITMLQGIDSADGFFIALLKRN